MTDGGMKARRVRWVSGAASAVAAMLDWREHPHGVFATCETGSEHDDNARFMLDVEAWLGQPILRLRNKKYSDTLDVWTKRKFISGPSGAPCTGELKREPRFAFQLPDDIQIFGYTCDASDVSRAARFREHFFEVNMVCPLIDKGLDKAACRSLLMAAGIAEPVTYAMGFPNANCLKSGCGKATSPNYWALHRKMFPEGFSATAKLARTLGARLARINDEHVFIDDIPADWPTANPTAPACDFLCHLAAQDLSQPPKAHPL